MMQKDEESKGIQENSKVTYKYKEIHKDQILSIARSTNDPNLFLTSSDDQTMRLFDIRMDSSVKIFFLKSHSLKLVNEQVGNCLLSENQTYVGCGNYILQYELRKENVIVNYCDASSNDLSSEVNQITFDKTNKFISANLDSGDTYIYGTGTLEQISVLKGQHKNACFSGDFIFNEDQSMQYCVTSGFDYNVILWDFTSPIAQAMRKIDLTVVHLEHSQNTVSPPVIYSVVSHKSDVLISIETGQIYSFPLKELKKNKKNRKTQPKPNFVLEAHGQKVMRTIPAYFDSTLLVSVSNDKTFACWRQIQKEEPQLIQRVSIQNKPNWIETGINNNILIGDVSNSLQIYQIK